MAAGATDMATAAGYYQRSIALREAILKDRPQDMALRRDLLVPYGNYASVLGMPWRANLGRSAEARVYCQKSVALARELADADPNNATAQFDWGVALARLGMVDPEPGGIAESLRSLQEGAAKMEPVAHANPKAASIAAQLSLAYEFMGHRYESLGQNAEAEARYRQSLAAVEPFSSPTGSAFCTLQAIESEEDLALYFARTGGRAAASDFGRRAVREADVFAAGDLKSERRKASAGKAAFVMADVSHTLGDEEQARQSAQRSLSIFETVHDATLLDWNQSVISSARKLSEKAFQ
jgi:tetratricopeptide (TPR) repeat protein